MRERELPNGLIWKECSSIRARFPMPETWFFKEENTPSTKAFFMTREQIGGQPVLIVSDRGIDLKTSTPDGWFRTGLSVNAFPNVESRLGMTPSGLAEGYLTTQKMMQPVSPVVREKDGPLYIFRRHFRLSRPATHFYIEFTGNDLTGTAYSIVFETPSDRWNEDKEIAETMVEKRVLDKLV